jgi:TRAP-type transport system periplasmic protein
MKFTGLIAASAAVLIGSHGIAPAAEMPFRISLNTGPNHVRNIALKDFISKLSERTKGVLDIQLFPSSQLFKGPAVPKALAQGGIEMGVPIVPYLSRAVPNAGILELPSFFGRPIDKLHALMDGPIGQELNQEIENKLKIKVIGNNLDLGYGSLFSTKTPLKSLRSLKGLKLRVPGSPAAKVRYSVLGVESVSISFGDLPIALAQSSVDGLMTTHETIRSAKLWESGLKYALDTNGTFFQYKPMIGNPTWAKLSPDTRKIITTTWADTVGGARKLAANRQADAAKEAAANGVTVRQATKKELAEFRAKLLTKQDGIIAKTRMDPKYVARAIAAINK